jgi:hypothetical protein
MTETSLRHFQILEEVFRSTNGAVYKVSEVKPAARARFDPRRWWA